MLKILVCLVLLFSNNSQDVQMTSTHDVLYDAAYAWYEIIDC